MTIDQAELRKSMNLRASMIRVPMAFFLGKGPMTRMAADAHQMVLRSPLSQGEENHYHLDLNDPQ